MIMIRRLVPFRKSLLDFLTGHYRAVTRRDAFGIQFIPMCPLPRIWGAMIVLFLGCLAASLILKMQYLLVTGKNVSATVLGPKAVPTVTSIGWES